MSASIIQVVSTNLTIRFEQINVSVLRILKHSDGTSHRHIIHLPRDGMKSADPLELRQLKMQGWTTRIDSLGSETTSMGLPALH
jgi:hypothetical protein